MRHKRTGPALATEIPYVAVAQLVEHLIAIQKVAGSIPVSHSRSHIEGYGRRGARWIELAVNADSPCSRVDMTTYGGCRQEA